MYTILYTYTMKHKTHSLMSKKRFLKQVEALWPALKGSLAQVRKPCIRPTCPACASGKKHPAFLLSFTQNGRRRCRYVPAALVAQMQKAIENGRRLEELLYEAGPLMLQEYREQRAALPSAPRSNPPQSAALKAQTKEKS